MTQFRTRRRAGAIGAAVFAIAGAGVAAAATASAAPHNEFNPYACLTLQGHRHHHADLTVAERQSCEAQIQAHNAATGSETLSYGGGVDGIGVQSGGKSKVYLVFYGTQWGTQGTDSAGNLTFSGDSAGAAGAAQKMFKGIGTGNETWSADLTQWCDGPNVASGATSCPSNANFIPYQSGGILSGVWYDNAAASPAQASGHQLGVEAVNAAAHFGNTTAASNRDAYYVILSPHGVNPDDYQNPTTGYCAWHDYNGDTSLTGGAVTSNYGDVAFSNQPYNIDQGANCGVGFVNSPGTLDGYTMTLGHEWHEMMSDQNPAGGWTNHVSGSSYNGQENSDECAWLKPGTTGGAANITFGTQGTFAEQASWSNDTNSCAISHTILNHGNTVTVTTPATQNTVVNTAASLQISASDSASGQTLTYSATGLPAGLSINSSTGLISGTPTATGTSSVTVTATDATNASGSASFSWNVNPAATETVTVTNPGNKTATVGTAISTVQISATDSASKALTYSATGLPAGLSISSSGAITGTPTAAGTSNVVVTATSGTASGTTSFTWTVNPVSSGCTAAQLLGNAGFETGSAAPWAASAGVIDGGTSEPAHSGSYKAWLDGYGQSHTDTLSQSVAIPAGCTTANFSFWLHIDTAETTSSSAYDTLKVQVVNSSGTVLGTLATFSNLNAGAGYTQHSYSLAAYAGQTVTLKFTGTEDSSLQTSFVIDDTAASVN